MAHLSNAELVDSLGPGATPAVAAHLAACEQCRRQAGDLRRTVELVSEVGDPEPTPDFWPVFAARVRRAVHEEGTARRRARLVMGLPRWGWLAAGVSMAFLAATIVALLQRGPAEPGRPSQTAADRLLRVGPDEDLFDGGTVPPGQDEAWSRLVEAGTQVDWDAVSALGLGPVPGSAETAVSHLTEAERTELARLLEAALGGVPE